MSIFDTFDKLKVNSNSFYSDKYFWINFLSCSSLLFACRGNLKMTMRKNYLRALYALNFLGIPSVHYYLFENKKKSNITSFNLKFDIYEDN